MEASSLFMAVVVRGMVGNEEEEGEDGLAQLTFKISIQITFKITFKIQIKT